MKGMGIASLGLILALQGVPERGLADDAALDKTIKAWQVVEDHLAKSHFLGGEEFSLGDIPLGVWAYRWFNLPIQRPSQPNLNNWYERLKQRKPYQTHIMIPVT